MRIKLHEQPFGEIELELSNGEVITVADNFQTQAGPDDFRGLVLLLPHQYKLVRMARGMDGGENPDKNETVFRGPDR